jgi:hypothetical protein
MSQQEQSLLCGEARKQLEKEIAELEQKLQLYQLLLAIIEAQCGGRAKAKAVVIEYEDSEGRTTARLLVAEGSVRINLIKPLQRSNPYTKYLLRVARQLEEESPEVSVSEEAAGELVRSIVVQGLSRDQVEDILLAADYVFRRLGFRRKEGEQRA